MDVSLVLVFLAALLIGTTLLKKKRRLPPTRFSIPYIGTPVVLAKVAGRHPHEVFAEEAKNLGDIFSFQLANKLIVVLNSYDAVYEAFVKNGTSCSGRVVEFNKMLKIDGDERGIIFSQWGQSLKDCRRFALQALRDFGVGKISLEQNIETEVEALTAYLKETKGEPISFSRPVQKLVANVIFEIVFGRRWDFDDPEMDHLLNMTNDLVVGNAFLNVDVLLPDFIVKMFRSEGTELAKNRSLSDQMRKFIQEQIDEHEKTFDNNNIRDFVDFYWRTVKYGEEQSRKYITRDNMFQIILDLFIAGTETTSVSLDWAMLYMIEYPEIQKKCQEELERVVGRRPVKLSDRKDLPFIDATVMEVQRKATLVPLAVPHYCTDDVTLCGYDLPKGTILFGNLYATSYDPKYWTNPEKFDPSRFLDSSGNLKKCDAQIPFSTGPRMCLGEPLARMELFLAFANLLQRFTFHRENKSVKHPLKAIVGRVTCAPEPFKLRAECRS